MDPEIPQAVFLPTAIEGTAGHFSHPSCGQGHGFWRQDMGGLTFSNYVTLAYLLGHSASGSLCVKWKIHDSMCPCSHKNIST